ncbi:MAG: aldehyde dehydrogenase family protein [Planctomycetes bacterium]|nr:aldehyde dehydrogenase family protein [Planctomycetota bacterium]
MKVQTLLKELGLKKDNPGVYAARWLAGRGREPLASCSPHDGAVIARVQRATLADYDRAAAAAVAAFPRWRDTPAPRRGEVVRQIGNVLREHQEALGHLVSLEMGKILAEGSGEVQEMIDIADFAVGLSRQLYGLTMPSERPGHRMYEQWHPLGPIGIITAFNFPVAVWSWNAMIAAVCGDTMVWKPASTTPLCALAVQNLIAPVLRAHGHPGVMNLVVGPGAIGQAMGEDERLGLVSFTGSTEVGRGVARAVASRLGRHLLELGGNNAVLVMDDADLDLAIRAVLFGAVGTAGQRCTSTRRVLLHRSIAAEFTRRLKRAYAQVRIGDPRAAGTLMGPLVTPEAVADYEQALERIRREGGRILCGGKVLRSGAYRKGNYVLPTLVAAPDDLPIMQEEVFAPILYLVTVNDLTEAIAVQNDVPQGLSSAIFTGRVADAERFLSHGGSDCGIANVNIGTSGAEIGGAFGGEKDTGGGREAGSDAWRSYMRRQTCTLNWSGELPLAQGIQFG